MHHPIHRVVSFSGVSDYPLRIQFDDGTQQVIDFEPMLSGALFGPLRDLSVFDQAAIDEEAHTLVWPNGAGFDPAILHDWPEQGPAMMALARSW